MVSRRTGTGPAARSPLVPAAPAAAGSPVLALQRAIGNRAVARLLREPKAKAKPAPPHGATTAKRAEALRDEADETWRAVKAFSQKATPQLTAARKRVVEYLKEYGEAYEAFSTTLEKAEQDVRKTEMWQEVALAIMMGTGIGLAAAALWEAETFLGEALYEVAKEGVKEVVLHADHDEAPSFAPPPGVTLSDKAAVQWKGVAGAWEGLARLDNRAFSFDDYRQTLGEAVEGLHAIARGGTAPKTAAEYEAIVVQAERSPTRPKLNVALRKVETTLALFLETFSSPVFNRDKEELEEDLWIRWMGSGEAPKSVNNDYYEFFLKKARALDSKIVRDELDRVGVTGRLDLGPRWNPKLGSPHEFEKVEWWENPVEFYNIAKREEHRVAQIGRLGVVVLVRQTRAEGGSFGAAVPGVVHLRQDAYAAAHRQMPRPAPADEYLEIDWERAVDVEPGQVVIVDTTAQSGVQVRPVGPDGASLPVRHDETNAALRLLGFEPVTFDELGGGGAAPDSLAPENLLPLAREAIGWGIAKQTAWNITLLADEGVLISDKKLGPMVLVMPIGPGDPLTALVLKDELQVPRVVVVTPSGMPPVTDLVGIRYRQRRNAAIAIRDSALEARFDARLSAARRH